MKNKFSQNYHPFYQLPYCCVPAILQWILHRHNLDIFDQETIGGELGLRLPLKGKDFFINPNIKYLSQEPKTGYGTQIEKKRYSINNFFNKYKIPLRISEMSIMKNESELREFLISHLIKHDDIIIRYNNKVFKDADQKSYGHFSVITEFDNGTNEVTIGDPELPHFKKMSLDQIIYATSDKIDGIQRGFYIVSKQTSYLSK